MTTAEMPGRYRQENNDHAMAHIYGQAIWHDDVFIVANTEGLKALKQAIEKALAEGQGKAELLAADGEYYSAMILKFDYGFGSPEWDCLALPYTEDFARETRDSAVWPSQLVKD